MADDSKSSGPASKKKVAEQVAEKPEASNADNAQVDSGNEDEEDAPQDGAATSSSAAKKKKSKRKRIKSALTGSGGSSEASGSNPSKNDMSKAISGLSKDQIGEILKMNPSLARDLGVTGGDVSVAQAAEKLKKLSIEEILSGLASSGKNVKDMGEYKFWQTQPVPRLGDKDKIEKEGPIREVNLDLVRKEPYPMADGFEWVTVDIQNSEELKEVFELLHGHYVEDDEAMFRFNYSPSFLKW